MTFDATCPYSLASQSSDCDLTPGTPVIMHPAPGLDMTFRGTTASGVLFGFSKPHGFAVVQDDDKADKFWVIHPEAMTATEVF